VHLIIITGYLCAWLGARLVTLDIHGGTSEADIVGIFDKARGELEQGVRNGPAANPPLPPC
jgi:hypothetical protein